MRHINHPSLLIPTLFRRFFLKFHFLNNFKELKDSFNTSKFPVRIDIRKKKRKMFKLTLIRIVKFRMHLKKNVSIWYYNLILCIQDFTHIKFLIFDKYQNAYRYVEEKSCRKMIWHLTGYKTIKLVFKQKRLTPKLVESKSIYQIEEEEIRKKCHA